MPLAPKHNRHWFRVGLRELFWLVLVVALAIFGACELHARMRLEREVEQLFDARQEWFLKYRKAEPLLKERNHWHIEAIEATMRLWSIKQGWGNPEHANVTWLDDSINECFCEVGPPFKSVQVDLTTLEVLGWKISE
jgi:hypothetical protein